MKARFEENKTDDAFEAAMAVAKMLQAKKDGSQVAQNIKFAGQSY